MVVHYGLPPELVVRPRAIQAEIDAALEQHRPVARAAARGAGRGAARARAVAAHRGAGAARSAGADLAARAVRGSGTRRELHAADRARPAQSLGLVQLERRAQLQLAPCPRAARRARLRRRPRGLPPRRAQPRRGLLAARRAAAARRIASRSSGSTTTAGSCSRTGLRRRSPHRLADVERWATFDCYGTLIDWDGGVRAELARVFGEERADELLVRYHEVEPDLQRDGDRTYRRGADRVDAPAGRAGGGGARSRRVPTGLAGVSRGAGRARRGSGAGWRLAILSNTDDDFIAASQVQIGAHFDEVVVAQEIGSYKPAHRHWEVFFERTRAPREGHVHVGASLFHDIAPATRWGSGASGSTGSARPSPARRDPGPGARRPLRLPETLDELVRSPDGRAEPPPAGSPEV